MSTKPYLSAQTSRESREDEYIRLCGERGTETIAGTWLDVSCPLDPVKDSLQIAKLQQELEAVLKSNLSEREIAEWASMLCGGADLETWEQEVGI
jgi:hypothetical protein